tara:strand:+ start:11219 stop:12688 length:1470 start_codon:yes stop_codon:yes gene_type:complete
VSQEATPNGATMVCAECVGDDILNAWIRSEGTPAPCGICDGSGPSVPLSDLAKRVDEVYRAFYQPGQLVPVFTSGSDKTEYRETGEPPGNILSDMMNCDSELAHAIVEHLAEKTKWQIADGDEDIYDSTSTYEMTEPSGLEFRFLWNGFCEVIKHRNRFFGEETRHFLEEIFDGIEGSRERFSRSALRTIDVGEDQPRIFRGRMARDEAEARRFCLDPARELGPPPKRMATPNRMNPAGIRMFYGATNPETCLAELRTAAGDIVVIAEFRPLRPLRILDMTALNAVYREVSHFDPDFARYREQLCFLVEFHEEISRPIRSSDELIDYIPTQAVAEFLSLKFAPSLDGILFASSKVAEKSLDEIDFKQDHFGPSPWPEEGINIALFSHASEVLLTRLESSGGASNGGPTEGRGGSGKSTNLDRAVVTDDAVWDAIWPAPDRPWTDTTSDEVSPTLELVDNSLEIVEVAGVSVAGSYRKASWATENTEPDF